MRNFLCSPIRKGIFLIRSICLASLILTVPCDGQMEKPATAEEKVQERHLIVLAGHPGDLEHWTQWTALRKKLIAEFGKREGFHSDRIHTIPSLDRGFSKQIELQEVQAGLEKIAGGVKEDQELWIIVLGHGYFDGKKSWLPIAGPDLEASRLSEWLSPIKAKRQVLFLTFAASGYWIKPLAKPGRVVVSATEADQELNETIYASALVEVLEGSKSPSVSEQERKAAENPDAPKEIQDLLGLLKAVSVRVEQSYRNEKLLATEHSQLDDNGDGKPTELGSLEPTPVEENSNPETDGATAAKIPFTKSDP